MVDWLGRGGIAQNTDAWARVLQEQGHTVTIVTRPGRELIGAPVEVVAAEGPGGRVQAHRALARQAASIVAERQPTTVVVQNYVLPLLERPLYHAVRRTGAQLVVVVHDHRLHSLAAGMRAGLRAHLRRADTVVTHTAFVRDAVRAYARGVAVDLFPLPVPRSILAALPPDDPVLPESGGLWAVHFGVLKRRYKGSDVVARLAARGVPGWRFAALGTGAPSGPGLTTVDGYVDTSALVAAVRQSAVTLLPYRMASQSGAIVVAQALGSVPVANAVGGIPDQVDDGLTGRLLPPDAPLDAWIEVLEELRDDERRRALAVAAEAHVWQSDATFVTRLVELVR